MRFGEGIASICAVMHDIETFRSASLKAGDRLHCRPFL